VGIDDKPAASWTEDDLEELCQLRRREDSRLEFKRELNLESDGQKAEAERDALGMANGGGGYIIYGIAEAELDDGSTAADELTPIEDGALYDRLNNVLDSRGEPSLPFELHRIEAGNGGWFFILEVLPHLRPHRGSDGRYRLRRNARVRLMSEPEVAEAYRERLVRQAAALQLLPAEHDHADDARRQHRELIDGVFALYQAETGSNRDPGWLSVLAIPLDARETIIDPMRVDPADIWEISQRMEGRWRREEAPLTHYHLRRTVAGLHAQLPDRDDTYPRYLVRYWRNGVAEFGDLLEPMFPDEGGLVIPSAAIVEYVHDFLLLARHVYHLVGYDGNVEAEARLENIEGYTLGVRPDLDLRDFRPIREEALSTDPWRGAAADLDHGAATVARALADLTFLAADAGRPYFFRDGEYLLR
jgi:hypothetical protein